jgi:plasmid stability protein
MGNVTLTIDDEVLRRARIRALERGTSVNALIRSYLEAFAGVGDDVRRARILEHAEGNAGSSGPTGRGWTRDSLYER